MRKTVTVSCLLLLSLTAVACAPAEKPTDRVATTCMMGDLMYETRDGGYGFVERHPDCAHTA